MTGTSSSEEISLRNASVGTGTERRELIVALPPGLGTGSATRELAGAGPASGYPVIYLHDGQNLFDAAASHAGDWSLVQHLNTAARAGLRAVVVGIPNRGRRRKHEYDPFRKGEGGGDRYLEFVVGSVKPWVERAWPVNPAPEHTIIAGSSLGALISLYALYRYPAVFGGAGVLSPALWVSNREIFRFLDRFEGPSPGRIYLDIGAKEGEEAIRDARALRDFLVRAGAVPGRNLHYVEDPEGIHHESAWGERFRAAMPFLLGGSAG